MKIIYITTDTNKGTGYGQYSRNIITTAVQQGHEVYTLVQNHSGIIGTEEYCVLQKPHYYMWNPLRMYCLKRIFVKYIDKIQPDIIHVLVEGYIFGLSASFQTPVVLTLHGTYACLPQTVPKGFRRIMSHFFFTKALERVSACIAVSSVTKRSFFRYVSWYDENKIVTIYNSIVIPKEDPCVISASFQKNNIVTIGAVKSRKGIYETVEIFSQWAQLRKVNITYNIIGHFDKDSIYVKKLINLIQERKSEYFKVVFHGHSSEREKIKILKESSLYVHLEKNMKGDINVEGFGIGIIEAASYGIPALVAKGSATVEAVYDTVSGFVVDLRDVQGVYGSIDNLLLKESIQKKDVLSWAYEHSPEEKFKEIAEVYQSVCNKK